MKNLSRVSLLLVIFCVVSTILAFPAFAARSVGFQTGNEFVSTYIEGEAAVSCNAQGQTDFAVFRCAGDVFEPAEFVKFQGPKVDADKVVLSALHEDGSVREKSESFDPSSGLSTGRFNLWISTVFQRPLLKFGQNQISYTLSKAGNLVSKGIFSAKVTAGQERSCQRRNYFSSNLDDCRFSQNICTRYFQEENDCQ